jgi:trk system potassium uptake protein TrkH
MGLTPDLTAAGKTMVILLMYVGRLGPLMLTYVIAPRQERVLYRHAEGNIWIG